uniref:Site-2 protease family protein n=1 Tax=Eiseniibacteriota bacterium TaxID=2212470 RepID=A0A832HYL7_UNCEI
MDAKVFDALFFWFPAFLLSTTVHEAAHAWAALRGGDRTAYEGGQVSLSPLPHIRREPFGMVVVPVLTGLMNGWTMGWASAPYDPAWADRHPKRAAWMAAAGPGGNLALALLAFAAIKAGLLAGVFDAPERLGMTRLVVDAAGSDVSVAAFAAKGLSVLLTLNVLLAAFNLLPVPPLDGLAVTGLFLPDGLSRTLRGFAHSPLSMLGVLVAWQVFPHVARPLFFAVADLLHPGMYVRG